MSSLASTSHPSPSHGDQLAFLRRAAQDPAFLASIESDPQAAFSEYGLSVDSEQIPSKVTPPSAESILYVLADEDDSVASKVRWWFPLIPS